MRSANATRSRPLPKPPRTGPGSPSPTVASPGDPAIPRSRGRPVRVDDRRALALATHGVVPKLKAIGGGLGPSPATTAYVQTVDFGGDGTMLVSSSGDETARLWETQNAVAAAASNEG